MFTDIEGSTRLLERVGAELYGQLLARHRELLRAVFAGAQGYEVECEGDAFFVAFASASSAVAAAAKAREALAGEAWPEGAEVRVRIGIHSGEPVLAPPKYVGLDVHRAARIMQAGHGGQVLVSEATCELLEGRFQLRDLGEQRLKDLTEPLRLYQLGEEDFPPLLSLNRTNLPVAATPLLGRKRELAELAERFDAGARLVTLTGPGGSGKTRLALQAGAELRTRFPDGVFFVALAPLRASELVSTAIAETLGLRLEGVEPRDAVVEFLAPRCVLLLLDNSEHLPEVAQLVSELLEVAPRLMLLVTGRSPLRLRAEQELAVGPLPEDTAVELFVARAAAAGRVVEPDETVAAICRRLDNLPLAIELAAARTKLLAPPALMERLQRSLELLIGGPSDAPERQRTLRATIAWSHDRLTEPEQALFRRLAVFRGDCALEAIEAVCAAELETVQTLIEASLLTPLAEGRLLLLETVREYALERLDEADETRAYRLRHADYYLERLEEIGDPPFGPRLKGLLLWFDQESENMRAAADRLFELGEHDRALRLAVLLYPYLLARGRFSDARNWLKQGLAHSGSGPVEMTALWALGELMWRQGEPREAAQLFERSRKLAEMLLDSRGRVLALLGLARLAHQDNHDERALGLARQARTLAIETSDPWLIARAMIDLGTIQWGSNDLEQARGSFEEALAVCRGCGDGQNAAIALGSLGGIDMDEHDYAGACERLQEAAAIFAGLGAEPGLSTTLVLLGFAEVGRGRPAIAARYFSDGLALSQRLGVMSEILASIDGIAAAAVGSQPQRATALWGATFALRRELGLTLDQIERRLYDAPLTKARRLLGEEGFQQALDRTAGMPLPAAIEAALALAAETKAPPSAS